MRAPIIYLEKTKKKRDEPSSKAIFAELGTKANKTDENKTKKIPEFINIVERIDLPKDYGELLEKKI